MAAIAQWYSVELVMKSFLANGLIPKLAMRCFVPYRKDTLRLFPINALQSTHCGVPACQRLADRTQTSGLRW